ncbi:MAG: DUF1192 domain-containing protein [Sphingomonadales bacterium]|nr:DUF1192 domain-containing protein [Sphingomonadales bacterium]
MDDDDRPAGWIGLREDAAQRLARDSLDRLSLAELDARIALLEAEILRVSQFRDSYRQQRSAADALFRPKG